MKTYDKQKGTFVWAKDVVPTYAWFNGNVARVLAGLNCSGQLGWADTDMYWKVNHMVVPKAKALGCNHCHGAGQKRMDWKALGYEKDPRAAGGEIGKVHA